MTLDAAEFIRRFLLHVLPSGFHRIRHYGFFASSGRAGAILRLRELIAARDGSAQPSRGAGAGDNATDSEPAKTQASSNICPCCGGCMRVVETFARGAQPRSFTAEPRRNRLVMTAAPIPILIDDRSPTTSFAGASAFTPNPASAANLASLRSPEPPFDVDPPVPSGTAAPVRHETPLPAPPATARPIAKSP